MSTNRGVFVVFEGVDRSGKSTQSELLKERLTAAGRKVMKLCFPDRTTPVGKILDLYLQKKCVLPPETSTLLFSANRWEKHKYISDLLDEGTTVILDRYAFSGSAYASAAWDLDMGWCNCLDHGLLQPDVVYFIDVLPAVAASRSGFGGELYEKQCLQDKVAQKFAYFDQREFWHRIDGTRSKEDVSQEIWNHFHQLEPSEQLKHL